jgi:hypothetical protein
MRAATICIAATTLQACQPATPGLGGAQPIANAAKTGKAAPLSDAAFETMPLDDQYRVVNKLLSTIYSGVPVEEFFIIDSVGTLSSRKESAPTLATLRASLKTQLAPWDRQHYDQQITGDENAIDEQGNSAPV